MPSLACAFEARQVFRIDAREEISICAASIIAVERVAAALRAGGHAVAVGSVLIDFYL